VLKLSAMPDRYQALLRRLAESFRNQRRQWIIGVIAFVLVNGYIIYRLSREWQAVSSFEWDRIEPSFLAAAVAVQFIGVLLVVAAWSFVLRQYQYRLPYRRHFKVYTLANLARKLPGGIGVDLVSRVYMYDQNGGDRVTISFATLIEPLILGISATIVLLLTMLPWNGLTPIIDPLIPAVTLIIFLAIIPTPIFRALLTRVSRTPPEQQQLRWHHLIHWSAINAVTIALGGVTLFLFCRGLGVVGDTALLTLVQYWAFVIVSGVLFAWLPIDIGATNSVTILALATIMPMPQALLTLVLWRLWITLNEMLWGAIGFLI
jgi:glycosyltransferase 2 family protein